MKIFGELTAEFVAIDGRPHRVARLKLSNGAEFTALIRRLGVAPEHEEAFAAAMDGVDLVDAEPDDEFVDDGLASEIGELVAADEGREAFDAGAEAWAAWNARMLDLGD